LAGGDALKLSERRAKRRTATIVPSGRKLKFPAVASTTPWPGTWNENSIPVSVITPVLRSTCTGAGPIELSVVPPGPEIVCCKIP
jgi:hypothetical protein